MKSQSRQSCACGKCAGCRLFRVTYKVENGRTFASKKDYLAYTHQKEAREIIRLDSRAAKVRKVIDAMSDDGYIRHSHAIPISLRRKPTRKELEIGIPVCCNHETMQVSAFNDDMWHCRFCNKARIR